jgi:hypothetical protein
LKKVKRSVDRLRILILGCIVRFPLGGMFWHYIQYLVGLHLLGHDVWFLEDSEDYPCCYDPSRHVTGVEPDYGLDFLVRSLRPFGLSDRWAYFDAHRDRWYGPAAARHAEIIGSADLLLNVSGSNPIRPWLMEVPHRVFVDTDPIFEQVRQITEPERRRLGDCHNHFFTLGEGVARQKEGKPDDGRRWWATRQPIVLSAWPVTPGDPRAPFTTVMQWSSYPPREHDGRRYGMKSAAFEAYQELPRRLDEIRWQLALGSPDAPRDRLRRHGWEIRDPLEVTRDPWSYRRYLRRSAGEFSIAKHGYVAGRSGWFSERSAAYLASGRPVLLQETGFSDWMDTGRGLVPFDSLETAVEGAEEILSDYEGHCGAPRELAEAHFDSRKVLPRLLEGVLASRVER